MGLFIVTLNYLAVRFFFFYTGLLFLQGWVVFARGSFNDVSVLAYSLAVFNGRSEHVDEAANSYWAILIQELSTIGISTRKHFFLKSTS